MRRRLQQADRRRGADEKSNPHIALGRWQAVVAEGRNEIIHIGAGGAPREYHLCSAREDLPLSETHDFVREVFVHDNEKRRFAKHLDIDAHPTMAARPRTGVAAKLSRVLAPPPNG
jgi:hypothetical protein